ncbi:hypothetical protein [Candidatus Terasakiella magnetica]|uniref:hypothetical protein n=1 Tax=Candidatus Terasakiella magnetica TaxID=1867952 RepID=UPI000F83EC53|nr:hypothetical protein [Candidatus Terasakiella magnetica]
MLKKSLILTTVLAVGGLSFSQAMADTMKPAVAGVNGKVDIQGGSVGREGSAAVGGSLSAPVGHSYGVQFDGGLNTSPSSHSGGLAGHFFRRDPDAYLAGLTSMWIRVDGRDLWRNGLETEIYVDDFTFSGSLGLQNGYSRSTGYAGLDAGFYINDDLLVSGGVAGYSNYRSVYISSEWRPMKDSSLSLFGNIGAGNQNGGFATIGLRFSFGAGNITLKKQHREYDPPNILTGFTSGSSGGGAVVNQIINKIEKPQVASTPAPS